MLSLLLGEGGEEDGRYDEGERCRERRMRRRKRIVHSPRGPTYLKDFGGDGSYHGSRRRGG